MNSLTVLMTALNEQDNIKEAVTLMHQTLTSTLKEFKIIVVDDGSRDKTFEIVNQLNFPSVEIIRNSKNLGTGKSIRNQLDKIETDYYCWFPTDLELRPDELFKMIPYLGEFDVINSYLVGDKRPMPRQNLSILFTQIMNLTFKMNLPYYNGVNIIRRSLLPSGKMISSQRFFTHAEILVLSLKSSMKIKSVGLNLYPRLSGESKAIKVKAFWDVASNYIRLIFKKMRE